MDVGPVARRMEKLLDGFEPSFSFQPIRRCRWRNSKKDFGVSAARRQWRVTMR